MKSIGQKISYFLLGVVLSLALQQAFSQSTLQGRVFQTDRGRRIITATVENTFAALTSAGQTPSLNTVALSPGWHTAQLLVVGGPSVCSFQLEGSLDNTNWEDLSGPQDCTSITMFHVANRPVAHIRGNLVTFTGGTSVQFLYKGVK